MSRDRSHNASSDKSTCLWHIGLSGLPNRRCFVIPAQQYYRGKLEAYWDIFHGTYKGWRCSSWCIAVKPTEHYDHLMFQYANLRIETTDDCSFKMRGYNEVQEARVNRLYPGAYERAFNETIEWERRRLQSMKE